MNTLTQHFSILENISDALFILDSAWQFTYLNQKAEQVLGKPNSHLLQTCIWDECPFLLGTIFEQKYRWVMTQRISHLFEAFDRLLKVWWEVKVVPYEDGISVNLRDISERKRLETALWEQAHLITLENQISEILGLGQTLNDCAQHCTKVIVQELDVLATAIWTYVPHLNQLKRQGLTLSRNIQIANSPNFQMSDRVKSTHGASYKLFSHSYLALDDTLIGLVARHQQSYDVVVSVTDLRIQFSDSIAQDCSPTIPSVSPSRVHLLGYPLMVEGKLVGVIGLLCCHSLDQVIHEVLTTIAQNLAISIDRYQAQVALSSRRESLLFRLTNQIRNTLDLNTILEVAVNEILGLLQVEECSYLWCWTQESNNKLVVSHQASAYPDMPNAIANYLSEKLELLAEKIKELENLQIDDLDRELDIFPENAKKQQNFITLLQELDIASMLLIPVKTRSNHLGAILCSCKVPKNWDASDVELLQVVVDQLAFAIDQAEAFAKASATALAAQTQAKKLELALQELKQTQTQLIHTEKMSSLGQMVAGIAHEINNPINFITGNINYIQKYVQDLLKLIDLFQQSSLPSQEELQELAEDIELDFILDDLPKTLSSIELGANRIQEIVLSLRTFSRLDEAEMKFADIHEGIESTLLILHNRLKANSSQPEIILNKHYGNLPKIECYPGQLNQVLMNILSNGIDALEDNPEPQITIQTTIEEDNLNNDGQEWVTIRIQDNGVGIDEEVFQKMFDPFFTTKPVGKGTGLGLAITYKIVVEKHRGKLQCHSELGKGTEFTIQLPAKYIM